MPSNFRYPPFDQTWLARKLDDVPIKKKHLVSGFPSLLKSAERYLFGIKPTSRCLLNHVPAVFV